ncbi:sugar phosphate isomerase/epimerase family protein [Brachybacterium sacelli]|uniref:Sugar phosphate isomerase/epimerase n=1 Tax=Brachybacterium sacelli TaxID=173364 RepID=A0ABS4WY55_9MICO|nr:sugar phosphate isomerase/epimerase [Brachybacterium sacelli]MBP2380439.1 sugar phosphate isomerase/epimerase [Brachybacterium sacelli]
MTPSIPTTTVVTGHPARLGVSTISFRHRPLREALRLISATGAWEIDLGAIPAVTEHVPVPFDGDPGEYAGLLREAGLTCGAVNADPGDLNDPGLTGDELFSTVDPLAELAAALGAALIVPAGRADDVPFVDHEADLTRIAGNLQLISRVCAARGVRLLVEVLHHRRYVHTVAVADDLLTRCDPDSFGVLFDVSHVVASAEDPIAWARRLGDRIERVHLRDAVPGNLNLSLGAGEVDLAGVLATLESQGFTGTYVLELETHDVAEADREADVARSLALVGSHLGAAATA